MNNEIRPIERFIYYLVPNFILRRILPKFSKYKFFHETQKTQTPITFEMWYKQKILGHCRSAYWPVHFTSIVHSTKNIYCGIETSPGYSPGNYIQGMGSIYIGDYTQIAPNVGIISSNHDIHDNRKELMQAVIIGKYCWIGMGAIILPGVVLGDFTIVGAGSVVTKSFPEGFLVIAGNPAKLIKIIDKDICVRHKSEYEYNGYIPAEYFNNNRKKFVNI